MTNVKQELARKAAAAEQPAVKLTKNMTIADMIRVLEPEIRKALPSVLTPERFTRMALSALNNTPKLAECTPMSFIAALMNAAQLGLEPNTPLGQAYLIPYQNRKAGILECQFQIGYKGYIDLAYRTGQIQMIQARVVYAGDEFDYEFGLNPRLVHRLGSGEKGEIRYIYGIFQLTNGGCGFEVCNKADMDAFAQKYSQSFTKDFSPWKSNYEDMAKKTMVKRALKYAPIQSDFGRAMSLDESIKMELGVDMAEVQNVEMLTDEPGQAA